MVDMKATKETVNEEADDGVDFIISTVNEEQAIAATLSSLPPRRRSSRNHPRPSICPQYESKEEEEISSTQDNGRKKSHGKLLFQINLQEEQEEPEPQYKKTLPSCPVTSPHPYKLLEKAPPHRRSRRNHPPPTTPPCSYEMQKMKDSLHRRSGRNHLHHTPGCFESNAHADPQCLQTNKKRKDAQKADDPKQEIQKEYDKEKEIATIQQDTLNDKDDEPIQVLASRLSTTGIKVNIRLKKIKKDDNEYGTVLPADSKASDADDNDDRYNLDNDCVLSDENSVDGSDEDDWRPSDESDDLDDNDEDDWNPGSRGRSSGVKKKKGLGRGGVKKGRSKKERVKKERRSLSHLIIAEDKEDGSKWYKCTMCEKGYSIRRSMYQHLREHRDKSLYFKCTLCTKEFAYEGGLTLHMRLHKEGEQALFKCDQCGRTFVRKCDLEKHMVIHEESLKCGMCDKKFSCLASKKMHEKRHNMESKFKCDICGKMLKEKQSLIDHARTHSDERPHACDLCQKSYKDKTSLLKHKRKNHTHEGLHYCEVCRKGYAIASDLKRHMEIHNPAREKPFQCPHCDKRFIQSKGLDLHIVSIHKKNMAVKCFICDKSYPDDSQLKRHLYLQTGKMPHVCDVCGKSFKEKPNLIRHSKTHENVMDIKTFICLVEGCGKSYGHAPSLRKHMKFSHPEGNMAEDKGTRCHKCPKCEKQTFLLTRGDYGCAENPHVKGYLCDICGVMVTGEQEMLDHIIEIHT